MSGNLRNRLREFIIGMGTIFDLSGSIGKRRMQELGERTPEEEVERAWRMTGDALRQAMGLVEKEIAEKDDNQTRGSQ